MGYNLFPHIRISPKESYGKMSLLELVTHQTWQGEVVRVLVVCGGDSGGGRGSSRVQANGLVTVQTKRPECATVSRNFLTLVFCSVFFVC